MGAVLSNMMHNQAEDSLEELALLADTAGAEVIDQILQARYNIDPATYIGKGKVHQIAQRALDLKANVIIFDEDLSPVQMKNLEKEIKKKVVDRSGLILDIFARRARTKEAQTQVELAQLQYLYPRLTRQWTHLSRQEGGIGTRGPGETQLEVDRRLIRKRIGHLKAELQRIERQRHVRRKHRRQFKQAALVGYTNAGKSSLLNALSGAEVFVENRLFATLDATIRALPVDTKDKILLIDTVGFIRKLPHHLVASFRSTMEETVEADLLLHVIDITDSLFEEHIGVVHQVMREIAIHEKPRILVFNKVDLLHDPTLLQKLKQRYSNAVFVSALKGMGLETLRQEILKHIREEEIEAEVHIPVDETKLIAAIHEMALVKEKEFVDGTMMIHISATPQRYSQIKDLLEKHDGIAYIDRR